MTINTTVVLNGCETCTLTMREEHKLQVYENKSLRKTSGPTREEVSGEWMILYNEKLHDLYRLFCIVKSSEIKDITMGQTCSLMRKEDKIQNIGGKS
jgi:hypothetical protein